ncbi:hypothetical protein BIFPSEUDO_02750 [Bifidobacterium pseudocatenulatum DSM 20438 = JCM 1200 = LMG 10505]|uniref:Uncharacterized protein n=1 Tax=Bifidobacterium pseudocatenulatum DSM 20438 = JCM 1200 = LMG 10505 TaxID=547043 RepID=C0BQU5_BIFPS|nr:hypothetical protein BIFPSEUDO_02750 [Bifidobacterium pseudocatenulatum DSM 20438 = JCM 1200 = LMG 10505]
MRCSKRRVQDGKTGFRLVILFFRKIQTIVDRVINRKQRSQRW